MLLIGFDGMLVSRYAQTRLTTVSYPIGTVLPEVTNMCSTSTLVRRHEVNGTGS